MCMYVSALVVSQYPAMLLTPLTPNETRLKARDQDHKHGWGSDVR